MTTLSVVAIRLTRVSIPLTMVHAGSMYVIQKTERTVVELMIENGVTGLGETWGTPDVYALALRRSLKKTDQEENACSPRLNQYKIRLAAT